MVRTRLHICLSIVGLLVAGVASAQSTTLGVEKAETMDVACVEGGPVHPLQKPDGALVVIIFGSVDCPIANAQIPEIRRVYSHAKAAGATMYFVHPTKTQTTEKMREHARERGLDMPVLHDRKRGLVALLGATTTPEAFVLRREGEQWVVVYRGLIDNLYADVGRRRRNATAYYVREAIDAAVAKQPVKMPVRAPIGCLIERGTRP